MSSSREADSAHLFSITFAPPASGKNFGLKELEDARSGNLILEHGEGNLGGCLTGQPHPVHSIQAANRASGIQC